MKTNKFADRLRKGEVLRHSKIVKGQRVQLTADEYKNRAKELGREDGKRYGEIMPRRTSTKSMKAKLARRGYTPSQISQFMKGDKK